MAVFVGFSVVVGWERGVGVSKVGPGKGVSVGVGVHPDRHEKIRKNKGIRV